MNHFRIDVNLNTLQSKIHYKPKLSLQFIKRFWLFQKRRCKSSTNMLLYGFQPKHKIELHISPVVSKGTVR